MANNPPIPKTKKLPKIGKLQKECDTLMQQVGRMRYKVCESCGGPMYCLHHFFPKSISARLRYDWDNLIPICMGCHMRHHQAGDPRVHETVTFRRGGEKWFRELDSHSKEIIKVNRDYYLNVLAELNKMKDTLDSS